MSSAVPTPPGPQDFLTGTGLCGNTIAHPPLGGSNGRCGYGPRLPLLVISPTAKHNFVDHTLTDQSSILRFIEDNWNLGRIEAGSADATAGSLAGMFDYARPSARTLILDPSTGGRRDTTLLGLDATVPFGEDYGEVTAVPGEDEFVIPGWTDRNARRGDS